MFTLATRVKFFVMVLLLGLSPSFGISGHTLQVCVVYKPRGRESWDYPEPKPSIVLGKWGVPGLSSGGQCWGSLPFLSFQLPGVC
uniref:Secreted protein n=1 Tax=Mus musculus TaxID=10090 RepID=Q3UFD9_MOUSE|nr:unnamed protein product [Mus musculus]